MNFAQQTQLLKATEHFNHEMKKVYVRRNCEIIPFSDITYNPKGGRCYYLSTWALMGLESESYLFRGQIDLPERPGWKAQKNYKHGWVQFTYRTNLYIYDPLETCVWHQDYWEKIYEPHDITFTMSQQEILELALENPASDNAYPISDYIYQFKNAKDMNLQFNSERDGFLRDTLAGSQIRYGYGHVSFFLAESHT